MSSCQQNLKTPATIPIARATAPLMVCTIRRMACGAKEGTTCELPVDKPRTIHRRAGCVRSGVRQLLPEPLDDVDLAAAYLADQRVAPPGRPWVLLNMVVSIDGATAVEGRSGGLGGPADRLAFVTLRSQADVILVGAGTVRAERYGPPRTSPEHQAQRRARGQDAFPRLAVVSGRLDLDLTSPLFTETPSRPLVITRAAVPDEPGRLEAVRAVEAVADLLAVGDDHADLATALATLGQSGVQVVLCEGGPTLNDQLLAADLVDEACVTVGPLLAGGRSSRMISGPAPEMAHTMRLARAIEDDGTLLLRYVRPA